MLKQKYSRRSGWENCRHDQIKAGQSRSNVKVMLIAFILLEGYRSLAPSYINYTSSQYLPGIRDRNQFLASLLYEL